MRAPQQTSLSVFTCTVQQWSWGENSSFRIKVCPPWHSTRWCGLQTRAGTNRRLISFSSPLTAHPVCICSAWLPHGPKRRSNFCKDFFSLPLLSFYPDLAICCSTSLCSSVEFKLIENVLFYKSYGVHCRPMGMVVSISGCRLIMRDT